DEVINIFKGKVYTEKKWNNFIDENYLLGLGKNKWLLVINSLRYTNHSCNPNSTIKNGVQLVALREIPKDEEVNFDYALTEEDPYWRMECHCGERNCRGIIVSKARF
ncbi:MAG: SET domain-containing protein-lysine N-methyltransferase, partial [Nanoarchaeota archaeon]|nr:SET domain-containing protein-lysine N-methyltransferase [Nanoarchaeota archaeon]